MNLGFGLKNTAKVACSALLLGVFAQSFAARQMENLNRGLSVGKLNGKGVFVSWRLLGSDDPKTAFNLYRDGVKIASVDGVGATSYTDTTGSVTAKYEIAPVVGGVEGQKSGVEAVFDQNNGGQYNKTAAFKTINVDVPKNMTMPDGEVCTYTANDMSVGDLDGDGKLELIVKWDPSNSKDNSNAGYTGNVYIDAYKFDGTKMWRIDLGKNIRAGAHYTQFQVYDYDGDGKAEIAIKTADGTIDGTGKVIGNASIDNRDDGGRIMTGNEYLTMFEGATGAAITTVDYVPARSIRKQDRTAAPAGWGDNYGNRSERYLAGTAYLDGEKPSLISVRGYYTASYVVAWDFDGKNLKQRWFHKSETPGDGIYGQGNHNLSIGDLDGDGKDEILLGAGALKSDGSLHFSTKMGHGDALHLSDMDPDRPGLESWDVHEDKGVEYSDDLRDGNGELIYGSKNPGVDNGRGMAADVDSTVRGFEMWSGQSGGVRNVKGEVVSSTGLSVNFRIYWDGDLQDELFDRINDTGNKIEKYNSANKTVSRMLNPHECNNSVTSNSTKGNPGLVADVFGDWREELIMRNGQNPAQINIISTTIPTNFRVYTLLHDSHYRVSIAWQNTAYNQPPHLGYYLPDAVKNLQKPDIVTGGESFVPSLDPSINLQASKVNAAHPVEFNGFEAESTNGGFEEEGYMNFANEVGSFGTWEINAAKASELYLTIRYANGGNAARNMNLSVNNGANQEVTFYATGAWTTWEEATVKINLEQGKNTIKLTSITADGGPNVDMFYFSEEGITLVGVGDEGDKTDMYVPMVFKNFFNANTGMLVSHDAGSAEISVFNMSGRLVGSIYTSVNVGTNFVDLQQEPLAKGMYIVKVRVNGKFQSESRFIKK